MRLPGSHPGSEAARFDPFKLSHRRHPVMTFRPNRRKGLAGHRLSNRLISTYCEERGSGTAIAFHTMERVADATARPGEERWRVTTAASLHKKVLIVDDEQEVRQVLRRILEKEELDVDLSASADEALDRLHHGAVDLVVTDLNMPGKGGLELIRTLHGDYPDIKVIVLTACTEEDSRSEAVSVGAIDYIVKPMRRHDIVRAVRTALGMGEGRGHGAPTGQPAGGPV